MKAELRIVQTSAECCRYRLIAAGVVIWQNRVHATPAGHKGARERMAAWALAHEVIVKEAVAAQPVTAGSRAAKREDHGLTASP